MEEHENWNDFVKAHLTVGDMLDGFILVTRRGDCIYSWGKLEDLDETYFSQFLVIFSATTEEQDAALCQKGFVLQTSTDMHEKKYIIYSKSFCSVYAVTRANRSGVIACSLPNGVLVATYSFPCTSVKAIEIVEKACELLRG
ncbi:uncharacterized protein [Montipora capricornis]|uniref:uncharacterized protein n=1 Tax=Montipora foliosa TaxID=591990 RepID=UPI0035F100F5